MDPTQQENYYKDRVGDMFIGPARVRVRAVFSSSGAVATVSSTRRQSHQCTVTGATGSYAIAGLPRGKEYHVAGISMAPPTGTQLVNIANVLSSTLDPAAGTLTFKTRRSDTGAEAAPADGAEVFITLDVETGVYS